MKQSSSFYSNFSYCHGWEYETNGKTNENSNLHIEIVANNPKDVIFRTKNGGSLEEGKTHEANNIVDKFKQIGNVNSNC